MRHIPKIFLSLGIIWILNSHAFKVFEFSTSLEENSKVSIKSKVPTPAEFTLCLDFYSRLDLKRRLLKFINPADIDIYIAKGGYVIYVQVAGILYLAIPDSDPPYHVQNIKWESICVAYNSKNQAVTVAFSSRILVSEENIFPNRKLTESFLNDLTLGEKDKSFHFAGDLTRFNIWSKVLDDATLKNITTCGSSALVELPDILNWDNVEVTIEGEIKEKYVDEYPCTSGSSAIKEVLMPDSAESMYEALKKCKGLGGKLHFPFTEEDVGPFVENVKSKLADSDCSEYVWSNYYKNDYADNNWTIIESMATYSYPPFENAGWIDWAVGEPNGKHIQTCGGITIDGNAPNNFFDLDCMEEGYCYVCR